MCAPDQAGAAGQEGNPLEAPKTDSSLRAGSDAGDARHWAHSGMELRCDQPHPSSGIIIVTIFNNNLKQHSPPFTRGVSCCFSQHSATPGLVGLRCGNKGLLATLRTQPQRQLLLRSGCLLPGPGLPRFHSGDSEGEGGVGGNAHGHPGDAGSNSTREEASPGKETESLLSPP